MHPSETPIRWGALRGVRAHLLLQHVGARVRTLACVCATQYVLTGSTSAAALAVTAVLTLALQSVAHVVVSLAVLPAQSRSYAFLHALTTNAHARRMFPGLVDALHPTVSALERMRAHIDTERERLFRDHSGGERVAIRTPDGCVLDGALFRAAGPSALNQRAVEKGVIVYFGGNGEHYEFRRDMLEFRSWGLAVMLVNYRGVGRSTGTSTRDGLVTDAASVLAFLTSARGFSPHRVVIMGHSIGGAIGTEAARFFPEAFNINDRSFGALSRLAMYIVAPDAAQGSHAHTAGGLVARYAVYLAVKYLSLWEMDSVAHWHCGGSQRCIIYAPDDAVIPLPTQLHVRLEDDWTRAHPACPIIRISPGDPGGRTTDSHNRAFPSEVLRELRTLVDGYIQRPERA